MQIKTFITKVDKDSKDVTGFDEDINKFIHKLIIKDVKVSTSITNNNKVIIVTQVLYME